MSSVDESAFREALKAYDHGDILAGESVLADLSKRHPNLYEVNETLGGLYAETGDFTRALPLLQRACAEAPGQALAHANLGAAYLKLSRLEEALRELEWAGRLDPDNAPTQVNLGQALMLSKRPKEAARALTRASRLRPADTDIKYNLALSLYESGSPKEGAAVLGSVPEAEVTAEMHSLAGDAEEQAGDYAGALRHFEEAARLEPSDANLYAEAAELLRHWNWEEAIRIAEYGSARYPASARFKVAAGIAYYGKGDYKPAVQTFSGLLQGDPNNATLADLLGRSCAALADGEDPGCSGIYDFAQRHPGNAVLTTYAAVAILHAPRDHQNLDQAAALLQAAIAADPKYAEAYLRMGVLEQMRLRWAESASALETAIALNPKVAEAHYRLSRAYAHLGRREEAQAEVELNQRYAKQAKDSLDARMQEVMRFVLSPG